MVDWSSRGAPSPRSRVRRTRSGSPSPAPAAASAYFRTRAGATRLARGLHLAAERAAGRRVLAGFDFPFGYPARLRARASTGAAEALAALGAPRRARTRRCGQRQQPLRRRRPRSTPRSAGPGPFWGNGLPARDFPRLPAQRSRAGATPARERRLVERAPYAQAQVLLAAQRRGLGRRPGAHRACPRSSGLRRDPASAASRSGPSTPASRPPDAPIVLAEVYPSLLAAAIRAELEGRGIRDAAQVRVAARAYRRARRAGELAPLFEAAPDLTPEERTLVAREEAWILGAGHEAALRAAAAPPPAATTASRPAARRRLGARRGRARPPPRRDPARRRARDRAARRGRRPHPGRAVRAARANPPAANAAVDGYGFAHAALGPAPHAPAAAARPRRRRRALSPAPSPPGQALRILTGALLPDGRRHRRPRRGRPPRRRRDPLRARAASPAPTPAPPARTSPQAPRSCPRAAGSRRRTWRSPPPPASARSPVRRRLRVAVLSTGDELRAAPAAPPRRTRPSTPTARCSSSILRRWDMEPGRSRPGRRHRRRGRRRARPRRREADAILTSGGASAGDEDHVAAAPEGRAARSRPGASRSSPAGRSRIGRWRGRPVFGLPGNPVAAFVCTLDLRPPGALPPRRRALARCRAA